MLPRPYRLRKKKDFSKVLDRGKAFHTPLFVLLALKKKEEQTRVGFLVSKKFDKRAVTRNRAKRMLSEGLRMRLDDLPPYFDIILIARKPLKKTSLKEIGSYLDQVLPKISN